MDRRFVAVSTLALILTFVPGSASARTVHPSRPGELLTVEHAEFVLSPDPAEPIDLYLVVWNGTGSSVTISGVTSPAVARIAVSRGPHSEDMPRAGLTGGLAVPARSELLMKETGLHLLAAPQDPALSPGAMVPVTVSFFDGSERTIVANVLAAGSTPEDHHHGS